MPWTLTSEIEPFATVATDLLAGRPAEHTIALTVIDAVRGGHRWSEAPMLFGWHEDGGAVLMTPPYELILALLPAGMEAGLAAALREAGEDIPGVNGEAVTAERFAAVWTARTGLRVTTALRLRLHVLGTLVPPDPAPAGRARRAAESDLALALDWAHAFVSEVGVPAAGLEATTRERLDGGRLWLWEDGDAPVALAHRTAAIGGVSRVTAVYTPPSRRRRGYGAAATAACAADALEREADSVVLFTDLANATANALYRRLGFEPRADYAVVRFEV